MDLGLHTLSQAAATRKPMMGINFSASAADSGGGLMDSVAGVASAAGIDLSAGGVDPWLRSVASIIVESSTAPRVDQAKVILADDAQAPQFGLDDEGTIELGYSDDQLHPVFNGRITGLQSSIDRQSVLTVCNSGYLLSQLRVDQSFEQQSAGDIVQALADSAGVETDTIEAGVDLPFYVVDSTRNLYQHIALLAEKSGLLASITAEGKLQLIEMPAADGERVFRYGVDIISLRSIRRSPSLEKVTLVGAGAAGSQGADAWSWLLKDPGSITASVGDGEKSRLVVDPSLRSGEAVQQASAGKLFLARQQGVKADLTVVGTPEIRAGVQIEIADMPAEQLNGSALVESVRHIYGKKTGFISEVRVLMQSDEGLGSLLSSAGLGSLL